MAENRLARESSPYLRQHAHNPVDWYPWGEEALALARREDRPLFLSVGYSACHWCHVMAHESFEDPAVAQVLNARFVPVKVDREERPDLDALYMRAVQLLHGQGGWPLNVFLTPDLKPFFGGTYFPRESRFGMTGFREVLLAVDRAYRERRGELEEGAAHLARALAESFRPPSGTGAPDPAVADWARRALLARFDEAEGGFGEGPKFPQPALLGFLVDESIRRAEPGLAEKVWMTLRRMEAGGVRDALGGGFHRYSVDGTWHVPHYEKMLYDNAQLASLYFRAHALTGDEEFGRVGEAVLGDLARTMAAPGGGFVAALDADSEGEEGRFYLWTPAQLRETLGSPDAELVAGLFGITSEEPDPEGGTLHRRVSWRDAARASAEEEGAFRRRVYALLDRLREARESRVRPGADTKVLTDWNALATLAFLAGHDATGRPDFLARGIETLEATWGRCWDGDRLHHVWDGDRARVPGFLSDYAFLASAFWEAFAAAGEFRHLERAVLLTRAALARFRDDGGHLFDTPAAAGDDLLFPVRDSDDGVLPSATAVLARVLWSLERLSGEGPWREALDALFVAEAGSLHRAPGAHPLLAGLLARRSRPSIEIVIAAPDAESAAPLMRAARRVRAAGALVVPCFSDRFPEGESERLLLLRGRRREEGAAAFICAGGTCRLPVTAPEQFAELLKGDLAGLSVDHPDN